MSKIDSILGREKESVLYTGLANFVRLGFNKKFFNPETCQYDKGSQSSNTLAIYLGLTEPQYQKAVVENIAKKVREKGNHFTAGNMGTKAIVETLCNAGIGMEPYAEAFREMVIAPHVPRGLSRVEVAMDISAGKVRSAREKPADKFVLKIEVPFNIAARVVGIAAPSFRPLPAVHFFGVTPLGRYPNRGFTSGFPHVHRMRLCCRSAASFPLAAWRRR
jgi:hypothetical protein